MKDSTLLALGDCNTLGVGSCLGSSYPEMIGRSLNAKVINMGTTMSTTREGSTIAAELSGLKPNYVCVQYGLVDSWITIKSLPYIPYYPDTFINKISRKFIKKIRKLLRNNKYLKKDNVVESIEYQKNLEKIADVFSDSQIFFIETAPNSDLTRVRYIKEYNLAMRNVADSKSNVHFVSIYDELEKLGSLSLQKDGTHLTIMSYELIASKIMRLIL